MDSLLHRRRWHRKDLENINQLWWTDDNFQMDFLQIELGLISGGHIGLILSYKILFLEFV